MALPNDPLDDDIDAFFKGAPFATLDETWRALRIKKSYGHQLINRGELERLKFGGRAMITTRSIKKYVEKQRAAAAAAASKSKPVPKLTRPTRSEPLT